MMATSLNFRLTRSIAFNHTRSIFFHELSKYYFTTTIFIQQNIILMAQFPAIVPTSVGAEVIYIL
jgi:hypothetical protein